MASVVNFVVFIIVKDPQIFLQNGYTSLFIVVTMKSRNRNEIIGLCKISHPKTNLVEAFA